MTGRLDGKVALITGSDSGIGQATAAEFAKEGADVVVHFLHDEEGAQTTRKAVEAEGRRAVVVRADIREEAEVTSMFDEATAAFGALDILMNNAGVDASGKKVAELPTEVFDNAIRTNLYGTFFCCRRFIQLRATAGGQGKIINYVGARGRAQFGGRRLRLLQGSDAHAHPHPGPGACAARDQRQQPGSRHGAHAVQPGGHRRP